VEYYFIVVIPSIQVGFFNLEGLGVFDAAFKS